MAKHKTTKAGESEKGYYKNILTLVYSHLSVQQDRHEWNIAHQCNHLK